MARAFQEKLARCKSARDRWAAVHDEHLPHRPPDRYLSGVLTFVLTIPRYVIEI